MKKYAIIVAGGSGSRMQSEVPKQFLLLNDKTILVHSIAAFVNAYDDITIIVVLPQLHFDKGKAIVKDAFPSLNILCTIGGETRFHSVKNGLQLVLYESIVFVHDAVRCLVSANLIQACFNATLQKGSAIPAVNCKDSIRLIDGENNRAIDRVSIKIIQTPQTFLSTVLIPAFACNYSTLFTDEASVVESNGGKIHLIEGEESNIKITTPEDLLIAEQLITST